MRITEKQVLVKSIVGKTLGIKHHVVQQVEESEEGITQSSWICGGGVCCRAGPVAGGDAFGIDSSLDNETCPALGHPGEAGVFAGPSPLQPVRPDPSGGDSLVARQVPALDWTALVTFGLVQAVGVACAATCGSPTST